MFSLKLQPGKQLPVNLESKGLMMVYFVCDCWKFTPTLYPTYKEIQ